MKTRHLGLPAIFAAPLVIAGLSLVGLIGALLADGLWDWLGAGLLAVAVAAVARARIRASRG